MATRVTSKGQVTIPKRVRERLSIEKGSLIDFELTAGGQVVLLKVGAQTAPNRFEALRGRASKGTTTDEIMALTRGEPTG